MPYYIYRKMSDAERAALEHSLTASSNPCKHYVTRRKHYATRADAFAVLKRTSHHTTHEVVFVPTWTEIDAWRQRELDRFDRSEYLTVPWNALEGDSSETRYHFAHLAVKDPSKIAFTESAEKGHLDKQTVMAPGRYLERYYADYASKHASWIAELKAVTSGELQFANAETVARVYCNGPSSCMDGPHYRDMQGELGEKFPHPASVYLAPGQLRVVYYGALSAPSQRAVVWPEQKQYVRIYGSGPLETILKRHGYSKVPFFDGATVARISWQTTRRKRGRKLDAVVLPYIDSGDCLDHQQENYWANANGRNDVLVLSDEQSGSQSFSCQCCDGVSLEESEESELYTCNRCGYEGEGDPDRELCDECAEQRWTCDHCYSVFYSDDESSNCVGDYTWCDACVEENTVSCAFDCGTSWIEYGEFTNSERRQRRNDGTSDYCRACASHAVRCDACGNDYHNEDHDTCPRCPRAADTTTQPLPFAEESEPYEGDTNECPF